VHWYRDATVSRHWRISLATLHVAASINHHGMSSIVISRIGGEEAIDDNREGRERGQT
jgi:hypothetical protein